MKRWMMSGIIGLILCGASMEAGAVSLSVDLDPGTAGIQNQATIMNGDTFTVDVVISDLTDLLQGFEFDLDFVLAVVNANNVLSGGFLTGLFGELSVAVDTSAPDVNYDLTAIFTPTNNSTLPLASITFLAVGVGMSDLTLNDVILVGTTGPGQVFEISPVTLQHGKVTVTDGQQPIPEPGTLLLLGSGLGAMLLGQRMLRT